MTDQRLSRRRLGMSATVFAGLFVLASMLFVGSASAQTSDCPAGGRGGAGGDAGRSVAGSGGLAFTVGGFGTTGSASAPGGVPGSARGGDGARGGSGTLPICNQNTNGGGSGSSGDAAPAAAAPAAAAPVAAAQQQQQGGTGGGQGGGLARTGARTNIEVGLAGLALALGGMFLFFGQPAKQAILRLVGATPAAAPTQAQDWNVLGWSPPFRKDR